MNTTLIDMQTCFDVDDLVCFSNKARGFRDRRVVPAFGSSVPFVPDVIAANSFALPEFGRSIANVYKYRSGVVEFDTISPSEQEAVIKEAALPFSLRIYTGGKGGWHWVWALEEPFKTEAEYYQFTSLLLNHIIPHADRSNKNPDRFRRLAGVVNSTTDVYQELVEEHGRVTQKQLEAFLRKHERTIEWSIKSERRLRRQEAARLERLRSQGVTGGEEAMRPDTLAFLRGEIGTKSSRHNRLLAAAQELFDCGFDYDEALVRIQAAADLHGITADPLRMNEAQTIVDYIYSK